VTMNINSIPIRIEIEYIKYESLFLKG